MIKIGWNDGHTTSGIGTGAVGIIKETDRNRRVGAKARNILLNEYEGVAIIDCTFNVSSNDMAEAVNKANSNNCDVFISNHGNAGGGYGFESFYSRKSTQKNIDRTKIIHNRLVKTNSCLANRRCCDDFSYKGYDLYVLINTKMEAHLFELGFIDNQKCVNAFNDEEVARALAEGIAEAYNIKKKTGSIPTSPPTTSDLYRVRKSWGDAASQKGAYSSLENAKNECNKHAGHGVYDNKGIKVYPTNAPSPTPPTNEDKIEKEYNESGYGIPRCTVNVRNKPTTIGNEPVATYAKNERINAYNKVVVTENYTWISYASTSGIRRYIAVKNNITGERLVDCY